jgi:hypothetical protein
MKAVRTVAVLLFVLAFPATVAARSVRLAAVTRLDVSYQRSEQQGAEQCNAATTETAEAHESARFSFRLRRHGAQQVRLRTREAQLPASWALNGSEWVSGGCTQPLSCAGSDTLADDAPVGDLNLTSDGTHVAVMAEIEAELSEAGSAGCGDESGRGPYFGLGPFAKPYLQTIGTVRLRALVRHPARTLTLQPTQALDEHYDPASCDHVYPDPSEGSCSGSGTVTATVTFK